MNTQHPLLPSYGQMLQEWTVAKVRAAATERQRALCAVRTRQDAERLVESTRRRISRVLGPLPDRTSLNTRTVGVTRHAAYRIEKVIFESRPGFPVTALVFVPEAKKNPLPAVLWSCGHTQNGKVGYAGVGRSLALQGYVAMVYDPIGQGERGQYAGVKEPFTPRHLGEEHMMLDNQLRLIGGFLGTWMAWDGIRALDVLMARDDVDAARVAIAGNSGGGTCTCYINVLDPRPAMVAPSCFVTRFANNIENECPQDGEQNPPGFLAAGLDMADYLIARAPRPTILLAQAFDFFDPRGTEQAYRDIRRIYRLLGCESNIELFVGPQGHGMHRENREAMVTFFNRRFGFRRAGREPDAQTEPEANLTCGLKWNNGKGPWTPAHVLIAAQAVSLAAGRRRLSPTRLKEAVCRTLGVCRPKIAPPYRRVGGLRLPGSEATAQVFPVETEPGIQALLYDLSGRQGCRLAGSGPARLYVPHIGVAEEIGRYTALMRAGGKSAFALDRRGCGLLAPQWCNEGNYQFFPSDPTYLHAAAGLMLNLPLPGRMVYDTLSVITLLVSSGYETVELTGRGCGSLIAAFAALLHPDVSRVTLFNAPRSLQELAAGPVMAWPLSHLPPRLLPCADLPDVYRALHSKRLRVLHTWDRRMRPEDESRNLR